MTSLSQPVLSHLEWTTRAFCIYLSFGDMRDDRYATASSLDVKDVIRPVFFGLGCGIHVECISSSHRRMFLALLESSEKRMNRNIFVYLHLLVVLASPLACFFSFIFFFMRGSAYNASHW